MVELVQELEKRNTDGLYDEMIQEAKAGEYHDFKNTKYLCGKVALASKLVKFPELNDIRQEILQGVYDESPDEDDKKRMAADLRANGGEAILKTLGLDKY